jgi:hypothetical protein
LVGTIVCRLSIGDVVLVHLIGVMISIAFIPAPFGFSHRQFSLCELLVLMRGLEPPTY